MVETKNKPFYPAGLESNRGSTPIRDINLDHLTPRQREILALYFGAYSMGEAAVKLEMAPNTIKHVHNLAIFRAFGAGSMVELLIKAANRNMLDLDAYEGKILSRQKAADLSPREKQIAVLMGEPKNDDPHHSRDDVIGIIGISPSTLGKYLANAARKQKSAGFHRDIMDGKINYEKILSLLSDKEREILDTMVGFDGKKSNTKDLAITMGCSTRTVNSHLRHIHSLFGLSTETDIALFYIIAKKRAEAARISGEQNFNFVDTKNQI